MLREIAVSLQHQPGILRRWFCSDYFDLYLWQREADGGYESLQLCYDLGRYERALTWKPPYGFFHDGVDDGDLATSKETPLLVEDGLFEGESVIARFAREADLLPAEVRDFVTDKLMLYADTHVTEGAAPDRKSRRLKVRREEWQVRSAEPNVDV
jgi:hypothetical protein